jgi:high-affinity Fe2+/Pb2+ permease
MSDQFLTLIVCLPLAVIIIAIAAILGMRSRMKFAKRLFNTYKARRTDQNFEMPNQGFIRALYIFALLSITSILILGILTITGILPKSTFWIGIFVLAISYTIIFGISILWKFGKSK